MEDWRDRVKIFYDAEFTGLHRNTSLISIGMVSQSGAYFYAEFSDYDKSQVNDWIQENVISNLVYNDKYQHRMINGFIEPGDGSMRGRSPRKHINMEVKGNSTFIRDNLLEWLRREYEAAGSCDKIQFYTDCYAYDWVVLNDLICDGGEALNIPEYIDYIPIDLSTALYLNGIDPDITREDFIGVDTVGVLKGNFKLPIEGEKVKHNSLWDALICLWCFSRISSDPSGKFIMNRRRFPESCSDAVSKSVANNSVSGTFE